MCCGNASNTSTTSSLSSAGSVSAGEDTKGKWEFRERVSGVSRSTSSSSSYSGEITDTPPSELNSPDVDPLSGGYLGQSINSLANWIMRAGRFQLDTPSPRSSSPDPPKTMFSITEIKRNIGHKKYKSVSDVDLKSSHQPTSPSLPNLEAYLRIQPLLEPCQLLWDQLDPFTVCVHPSSLPELYIRFKETGDQMWVLLTNFMFAPPAEPELAKSPMATTTTATSSSRTLEPLVDLSSSRSQSSEHSVSSTPPPGPFRVVARLSFATRISFPNKEAPPKAPPMDEAPPEAPPMGKAPPIGEAPPKAPPMGEAPPKAPPIGESVDVPASSSIGLASPGTGPMLEVKIGHVLMSEMVRQQLCLGACFVVKMQLVKEWKMPTVGAIYLCPLDQSVSH